MGLQSLSLYSLVYDVKQTVLGIRQVINEVEAVGDIVLTWVDRYLYNCSESNVATWSGLVREYIEIYFVLFWKV